MKTVLKLLENQFIKLTLFNDASADIIDKSTQIVWKMGSVALQEEGPIDVGHVWMRTERSICEQYPGRFEGTVEGERIRFMLLDRERREAGSFICRIELDGPWFVFRIEEIDEELQSLAFPPPIECESLVLPIGIGRLVRKPLTSRHFWPLFSRINMRWFGGLKGDSGWMSLLEEGCVDAGVLAARMSASPAWLKVFGKWSASRSVRYRFTSGGYVGMAKTFRKWAMDNGLFKSLREKMEDFPALRNLHGGRIFSFSQAHMHRMAEVAEDHLMPVSEEMTKLQGRIKVNFSHADAASMSREIGELGMKKGFFMMRGWINRGYDGSHPDVWPPEAALGTPDELHSLCCIHDPYTGGLHDNYQDMYRHVPSWPHGVNITKNGDPMPGGLWAGGQAYIINARDGLKYAERNWKNIKSLEPRAMFIDTTTACQMFQSYEEGNTLTRQQDLEYKLKMLSFFKQQGIVLGSEEVSDFGITRVDWFETRHSHVIGESIPLWPLVYHDAAFVSRYSFNNPMATYGVDDGKPWWLADMLWGYNFCIWLQDKEAWEKVKPAFSSTFHVDRWHERVGAEEMLSHRYLTEDFGVEETTFSNGSGILANFTGEERTVEGVTIPAGGYVIRD